MKKLLLFLPLALILNASVAQNNQKLETYQERVAMRMVREIEKNNLDSVFQFFEKNYLAKNKTMIVDMLARFYQDFETLPATRRFITLVWPTGINLFRFS